MWRQVWSKLIPFKVAVFVWKALHGRIPTRDELSKRGIQNIVSILFNHSIRAEKQPTWLIAFFCISWTLWLYRNERIFEKKVAIANDLYELALQRIGHWVKSNWPRSILSITDFIRSPELTIIGAEQRVEHNSIRWGAPLSGTGSFLSHIDKLMARLISWLSLGLTA
ncbi:hypothetical protein V6N13_129052 [Hibiscus sabdariffa]